MKRLSIAGMNILMVLVLAALGLIAWIRLPAFIQNFNRQESARAVSADMPAQPSESQPLPESESFAVLDPVAFPVQVSNPQNGIMRKPLLYTDIPSRPRVDVITYTVQTGDSLFSIADKYGLKPETILWGNFDTLEDNPHLLSTDQVLNILPTDGTYYQWNSGDSLASVASFFQVDENAIISYPGNYIDLTTAENSDPGIEPGSWLIVPGGKRPLKDWGPPAISRSNPASARYYGDGYCGSVYEGAIGTGTFIWPTTAQSISGYGYSGIHPAIDIAGAVGNATF
ncbi:MAG: LysM peptidoglycan-binding domain-containing protein, partial [Anaerolineales bacterium]